MAGSTERKRPGRKSKGAAPRKTKATLMREMLEGEGGASLDDLCKATGWQPHTVRAALSGLRKAGHVIDRTRDDAGKSIYRVTDNRIGPAGSWSLTGLETPFGAARHVT